MLFMGLLKGRGVCWQSSVQVGMEDVGSHWLQTRLPWLFRLPAALAGRWFLECIDRCQEVLKPEGESMAMACGSQSETDGYHGYSMDQQ